MQRRWTGARDLADVLEQLGLIADGPLGRRQASRISDELFAVAG